MKVAAGAEGPTPGISSGIARLNAGTHTPGPWACRTLNLHFAVEAANGVRVCDVRYVRRPDGYTSAVDARLIAAAPDLLDILERLLDAVHGDVRVPPPLYPLNALCDEARAAIAKATHP